MKKLILLLLVLVGGVMQASADGGKTVYFKPSNNWTQSDAKFAVWQFGGTSSDAWTTFSDEANSEGYYTATLGEGYTKMLFVRYPGGTPTWDDTETPVWNRSQDMPVPQGNEAYYTQLEGDWDYNVVGGDYYLCVSENSNAWTDATHYLMNDEGNSKYSYTINNQTSTKCLYYMIVPSSAIIYGGTEWGNQPYNWGHLIYADTNNHSGENPYVVNFAYMKDNVGFGYWSRWKIDNVKASFEFVFDRANMTFESKPYFTRTLPAAAEGYATFSSEYDVTVPEGLTAKYASDVAAGKITWEEFGANGIKAGQGALLKGTAGGEYKFTPATSAEAPSVNFMKAINEKKQLPQTEGGYTNYILSKSTVSGDAALGFYKVNADGSWCAAGTAYLSVPSQQAPEFIGLGETTGIANVNRENVSDNQYYMLDGRRVAQPTKGLYIVNGKKVIIK